MAVNQSTMAICCWRPLWSHNYLLHFFLQLREEITHSHHETKREQNRKAKLEKEVVSFRHDMEARKEELALARDTNQQMRESMRAMEDKIKELEVRETCMDKTYLK